MPDVHAFDLLMELRTSDIRLDCAALHLAKDVYPYIHVSDYLARLDALAARIAAKRPGLSAPLRYEAMRTVLVDEFELTGSTDDYYNPENSYLNRVLDRRLGIPITVSAVWIEVGRRLKWSVAGVGFPGHFLLRFDDPDDFVLVDPFNKGQSLSIDDCGEMLEKQFEGRIPFTDEYLEPVAAKEILARILNNLRLVYLMDGDWGNLTVILRRLIALEPQNGTHSRDLAALDLYGGGLPAEAGDGGLRHRFRRLAAAMLYRN